MSTTRSARFYRPTPRNLAMLAGVLARGGLVAAPTETVYGLAANALDAKACRAIFRAKGRPASDPLIVHVESWAQVETLAVTNEAARRIADAFWPGPLTLILPKRTGVPDIVTSGLPSVAVRLPAHPLFQELIRRSGKPLAAPSANPFGYVSPTTAQHVHAGLGGRISHILDGGACEIGLESTILDLRDPRHAGLLRPGAVSREALAAVLGHPVSAYRHKRIAPAQAAVAPGMLERHYSPRTPLVLHPKLTAVVRRRAGEKEALLFVQKPPAVGPRIRWLSVTAGLEEAAHTLFERLRTLDDEGWTCIHAELAPGTSALALAINDRLRRAAAKR